MRRLNDTEEQGTPDINLAREAANELSLLVKDMVGVEGVGISILTKGYGVKVNLSSQPTKELSAAIPRRIKDVPVNIQITGSAIAF